MKLSPQGIHGRPIGNKAVVFQRFQRDWEVARMKTTVDSPQLEEQVLCILLFSSSTFVGFFFSRHSSSPPNTRSSSLWKELFFPHIQCSLVLMQRNLLITHGYLEQFSRVRMPPLRVITLCGLRLTLRNTLPLFFLWYFIRIITLLLTPLMKFPETVWTLQSEKNIVEENSFLLGFCEEWIEYSNEALLTFVQGKVYLFIYFARSFPDFFFLRTKGFFILSSWITSSCFSVLGDTWPIKGSPRISFQQMHLKFIQDISDRLTHCAANTIPVFVV